MNKLLPLLVVAIMVLSGLGAVAISNEQTSSEKFSIIFSQPVINNENELLTIDLEESNGFLMEDDKPFIPCYFKTFKFPFGTKINKVTCKLTNAHQIKLFNHITPTPKVSAISQDHITEDISLNYGTEAYPSLNYDYDLGCGLDGRERVVFVKVEVYPIKYYPEEKTIEWATGAEIQIDYELPDQPATFDDVYDLLILTPSDFTGQLNSLVTHKNSRGVSTKLVTLDEVYGGSYFPVTGRDNQEKIKYFIKNAIEEWNTVYVMLVGGSLKFPTRTTHVHIYFEDNPSYANELFVSDLYYADVYNETAAFCTWDSNNNDVFGEFDWDDDNNFDEVDLYPDVYLSRLAAVSSTEVNTVVNKIKKYENDEAYTQNWFTDFVMVGGDTVPTDSGEIPEGEYIQEKIEEEMDGFIFDKIWATNGRLGKVIPPWGRGEIDSAINAGCGFLEWSGHGNPAQWGTHPWKDEHSWIPTPANVYKNTDVKSRQNDDELPIVIVGGCSNGKYNQDADCFSWAFLMATNGGGIASTGATGLLYGASGKACATRVGGAMEINMFKAFKSLGAITFGEMWGKAITRYMDTHTMKLRKTYCTDYKTLEQWQAFGDPSLAVAEDSEPPAKPSTPSGETEGGVKKTYTYTTSTTDPEGDDIYYLFDWGDGTYSSWVGPYNSGSTGSASHKWNSMGDYEIRVKAKDDHGVQGEWSDPLPVTMPRGSITTNAFFMRILERFPNAFPLIRQIFGL